MSLAERLAAQIRVGGPMTIAQFMTACLHDPKDGYYATRPALGAEGDFITAPLVSQMFGELIGAWLVECWERLGRPTPFRLVEIGPGDGTLMSDILRLARLAPDFAAAADLWLVEVSAPLHEAQRRRLEGGPVAPKWAAALSEVPGGAPLLLVANELLDCLPVRQYLMTPQGWAERLVGLDAAGGLAFGYTPSPGAGPSEAPQGAVFERSPAQEAVGAELGARIVRDGGAALLIDYGRDRPEFGDTLQALKRHQKVDVLTCPGAADLTVHADFPAVLSAARGAGAATHITTQGEFLLRLGLDQRAAALARARPDRAAELARQRERLAAPDQMGELFKAAVIASPGWPVPAFEEPA
ncbi:MAG: SAM-dependent methyltransferase [Phenylobacterium sp.]|jgi:SAM-dependent MidA family methyltransferase|uniref:class I SAM-dependent methyltransferase n=1 Tax=Phenylobacterium sp. TaxID=1871053 RepID=UPI002A358A0D|nr:SAM-dependent methyltransferase [Phenylobacterium sp.]MDX9997674.1 SAM-dependent methyltransferase [Phenylobacterium sp.]